jgi:hypothetical protein
MVVRPVLAPKRDGYPRFSYKVSEKAGIRMLQVVTWGKSRGFLIS